MYIVICKAPLTGCYAEALSVWQAGEKKSRRYAENAQFPISLDSSAPDPSLQLLSHVFVEIHYTRIYICYK